MSRKTASRYSFDPSREELEETEKAMSDLNKAKMKQMGLPLSGGGRAGEGSRGGKIIGHTQAGKPIYAGQKPKSPKDRERSAPEDHAALARHYHGTVSRYQTPETKEQLRRVRDEHRHASKEGPGGHARVSQKDRSKMAWSKTGAYHHGREKEHGSEAKSHESRANENRAFADHLDEIGVNFPDRKLDAKHHRGMAQAHEEAAEAHRTAQTGHADLRDAKVGHHLRAARIAEGSSEDAFNMSRAVARAADGREEPSGWAKKSLNVIEEMDKLMKAAQPGSIIGRTADGKEVYSHDADPLQKQKAGAVKQAGKPAAGKQPAKPGEDDEENGEGSLEHHRDRALAHLQAAQAHAGAASSAKKVEQAKDHKEAVGSAREASEAAMGGPEVKKALGTKADLSKALYPRSDVTSWAGQFYGTPLYVEALRCLKEEIELDRQSAELSKKEMGWRELQELPRSKREAQAEKNSKAREPLRKKREDLNAKRCGLEERLIDHKIEEAGQPIHKSELRKADALDSHQLRAQFNRAIITMVKSLKEPVIATKNNLLINMTAEEAVIDLLEKGGVVDGQAAGMREDARHRLMGMRNERMHKSYGGTAGGTIYQGEHDAQGSRGADMRETVARAQTRDEMIELDGAGHAGNGGLDEWFRDAWGKLDPEQAAASRPGAMRPKATGWQKASVGDQPIGVIDDDDPYSRSVLKGGQAGEHQSALRMAYQGNGRENKR